MIRVPCPSSPHPSAQLRSQLHLRQNLQLRRQLFPLVLQWLFLLFQSTRSLFTQWIGTIINYGLVTILLSAVFGLFMAFYEKAI
ncbi:type IV secretion system protein, partial [Xanthomonas euvesicatoria]